MYNFVGNDPIKWIDPYGLAFTDEHPGWMKLFCLLWKKVPKIGGYELGSWLYTDDTGDSEWYWWDTKTKRNSCSPKYPPKPWKQLAGSCHTHPPRLDPDPSPADKQVAGTEIHQGKPMYIISQRGIRVFNPLTGKTSIILGIRNFRDWCKCHGFW
jgi:hypothetical protein